MKMLPIETDPYIRAITYHAFPSAILNPRCGGEKKAEIAILNSHSHSWKYDASRALVHRERDDFVFTGDKYADGVEGIICREARAEDEIIVHVKYVQYTQPYGSISVFLSNQENPAVSINDAERRYHIGVYNKGEIFAGYNQNRAIHKSGLCKEYAYYIKLAIKSDCVFCSVSQDGNVWAEISSDRLPPCEIACKLYLGVILDLKENQYYNWLFTNYIQLYGRNVFTTDYYVDYYVTPEKDGLFYTIHSLLDYTNIDPALLVESGADMVRFIKTCINHGKYVEIRNLNEYYVEGSPAYGTETYYHKNLVFGWDDDNLYLLGQAGHVKLWKIKHSDLMRALDCEEGQLNIFTLNSIDSYYALNIDTIKDLLYEYWKGIDTNRRMEFIIPYGRQDERSVKSDPNSIARDQLPIFNNIYGMKIYDLFLENPRMFEYLLDDKRIPYFIYEHKKIMRDRVDFLRCKNHIIEEVSDQVAASADTVLNTARVLLNRCLKYQIAPKDSDRTRIKEVLRELKQLENQFYPQLIESLM